MSPQEFVRRHPKITYEQLAQLTGYTQASVKHWFCAGRSRIEPRPTVMKLLKLADENYRLKIENRKLREHINGGYRRTA